MIPRLFNWLGETRRVYFGNATTQRDFRVQLRGNKAIVLFSLYLILLIMFSMIVYDSSVNKGMMNIVDAQRNLRQFYQGVMIMLGVAIVLIAPAMASSTIVVEKQNRLMDLIFSAPVSARYYLVGKLIGIYRFIVLLLILSIPVTASCVMLGGATWQGVLEAYLLLSTSGLVLATIGLLHSCLAVKPTQALMGAYASTILYLILVTALATPAYAARIGGLFGPRPSTINDVNVFSTLLPFYASEFTGTFTPINGFGVPNWILNPIVSLFIVRLFLKVAESIIAPAGTSELVNLRINGLFYAFASYALFGILAGPSIHAMSRAGGSGSSVPLGYVEGLFPFWLLMFLGWILVPFITCYGFDDLKRLRPNGMIDFRQILNGSPAGAIPYIFALLACFYLGGAAGFGMTGTNIFTAPHYWVFALLTFASWVLLWSACRYASAGLKGVKTARNLGIVFLLFFVAFLPAVFSTIAFGQIGDVGASIWDFYPYRAGMSGPEKMVLGYIHSAFLLVLAMIIMYFAEKRLQKNLSSQPMGVYGIQVSA